METVKVLYANQSVSDNYKGNIVVYDYGQANGDSLAKLDWIPVFEMNVPSEARWTEKVMKDCADHLFDLLNVETNPLGTPEKQEMIGSLGLRHTSMSVGDMVEFPNGKRLVCMAQGWTEMRTNLFLTEAQAYN